MVKVSEALCCFCCFVVIVLFLEVDVKIIVVLLIKRYELHFFLVICLQ